MGANLFAVFSTFLLTLSFSTTIYSQNISNLETQYPLYEGVSSDVKSFDEKNKLGTSYTKLSGQSGSIVEKSIWESQKQLRDEIYDALGSYRISATLLDEELNFNGTEFNLLFTPALHPQRIVRIVNSGRRTDNAKTQYMVSDALNLVNTLVAKTPLNDTLSIELLRAQSIVGIQKISYANSLASYNDKRPQSALARYIDDSKNFDDYVQSQEKEQSRIFFKGFFDPYRVGKKFIKITAEKVKTDPTLKTGDILIKHFVRKQGPGIGASQGLAGASYNYYSYEELKIGLKKESDNIFLLKIQLEDGKNHDIQFKVGVPVIEFKPQRTSFDSTKYIIAERLYRLDLSNPQAAQQLDALLNNYGKPLAPAKYYEELVKQVQVIPGVVDDLFERQRQSLNPQMAFRNKTELGFFGFRTQHSKSTETNVLEPTEGERSEHVVGEVQRYKSKRVRFVFNESNEDSKKKFRILSRKLKDGSLETDLGFEYAYDDSRTTEKEYFQYLLEINNAFFIDKHIAGTQAQVIADLLNERLLNKTKNKDQQAVSAAIYFSQKFVRQIAAHKKEEVQRLLAVLILGNGHSWADLEKLAKQSKNCGSLLNPEYATVLVEKGGTSCSKFLKLAQTLVNMFDISKKQKYTSVTQNFSELVHDQKMRSFIPMMMLQIGLLTGFDSLGAPIFSSLDEAFNSGDVEMSVAFVGDGINGIIHEQVGDVVALTPAEYPGDFSLTTPIASSPLIIKSEVATDGSKIYLQFDSLVKAQDQYVLKGIASKYKMIKNDKPEALIRVKQLSSTDMLGKDGKVSYYRYVVELPLIPELNDNSDSTIQFWIEDGAGVRVSEPFSIKFKI